jgi:hypothetical protein
LALGLAGAALLLITVSAADQTQDISTRQETKMQTEKRAEKESPIVCSLTALNSAQRQRHQALGKQLRAQIREVRELPDGYAFSFPAEAAQVIAVAEWITLERLCCPFLTLALEVERESGPAWLRLSGRDGVKQFLRAEFGF